MSRDVPAWLTARPWAHRGLHGRPGGGASENSLPALRAAAAAGLAIELDARLTADGVPVVVHDDDLSRLTGRSVSVAASTAAGLAGLRLPGGERIPTLGDALAAVAGRVPVMIECKHDAVAPSATPSYGSPGDRRLAPARTLTGESPGGRRLAPARTLALGLEVGALEGAVARRLHAYDGPACVTSFNPLALRWFARHAAPVPRGQTVGPMAGTGVPRPLRAPLRRLWLNALSRPDFVAAGLPLLTDRPVTRWRARGRPVIAWTATTRAELSHAEAHADAVIVEADAAQSAVSRARGSPTAAEGGEDGRPEGASDRGRFPG